MTQNRSGLFRGVQIFSRERDNFTIVLLLRFLEEEKFVLQIFTNSGVYSESRFEAGIFLVLGLS